MGRILAIDYGRKRCGLAVTDENKLIAGPLETVPTHQLMLFLKDYCQLHEVECLVVGEPKQMNGNPSESSVYIDPFVKSLHKAFPDITIDRVDERFSSLLASRAIAQAGLRKRDRQDKALVDKVSAVIILQQYMENLQYKKVT